MESFSKLTDSLLPIIILVVIAGARLFTMFRRQARNRDQDQKQEDGALQGGGPQKTDVSSDRGFHPWEDEYRDPSSPVTIEEAEQGDPDDDDEFSAWSLSVSEDAPPVPASKTADLPAEIPDAAPSLFTALSSTSAVPVSGEVPAWLQSSSFARSAEAPAPVPAAMETAAVTAGVGGISRGSPNQPPSNRHENPVESRIRQTSVCSLPPLQQGVVWAEILGPPKGL
jgi:hypothetical protein